MKPNQELPRNLTQEELQLVRWLIDHGNSKASQFADQVDQIKVEAHCECGCASIDFVPPKEDKATGLNILSDYLWTNSIGGLSGIFLFAKGVNLAGLEVWSVDGSETPMSLPKTESLQEFKERE
jgi:hypothetical protein